MLPWCQKINGIDKKQLQTIWKVCSGCFHGLEDRLLRNNCGIICVPYSCTLGLFKQALFKVVFNVEVKSLPHAVTKSFAETSGNWNDQGDTVSFLQHRKYLVVQNNFLTSVNHE